MTQDKNTNQRRSRQNRSKRDRAAKRLRRREAGIESNYGRENMAPQSYVRHPQHTSWWNILA